MNLQVKEEDFDKSFDECASEFKAKQTPHRNEADLRRHVYDWLRINILKRQKARKDNGSKNNITNAEAKAKRNEEIRAYVLNGLGFEK